MRPECEPDEPKAVDMEAWRAAAFAVCRARGWSENWTHRLAAHVLEASEYVEAWRGKKGDAVEEAGDMLFTVLAMIPESISLLDVYRASLTKIAGLMERLPYAGEERAGNTEPAPPAETEEPKRICNRHTDCAAADLEAKAAGRHFADHCSDECCEECFGN